MPINELLLITIGALRLIRTVIHIHEVIIIATGFEIVKFFVACNIFGIGFIFYLHCKEYDLAGLAIKSGWNWVVL